MPFKAVILFFLFIYVMSLFDNNKNANNNKFSDDDASKLCSKVKQKFADEKSAFDVCIEGDYFFTEPCVQCQQLYLDVQKSFEILNVFMENKTCSDISDEQIDIDDNEKVWTEFRCPRTGWYIAFNLSIYYGK